MIEDRKGCGWRKLEQSFKTNHVKQEKTILSLLLETSQKLSVTCSKVEEGGDIPGFISEGAPAGCWS